MDELGARKTVGAEHGVLSDADLAFHQGEYLRLSCPLAEAAEASRLPETATCRRELGDFVLRARLGASPAVTAAPGGAVS